MFEKRALKVEKLLPAIDALSIAAGKTSAHKVVFEVCISLTHTSWKLAVNVADSDFLHRC